MIDGVLCIQVNLLNKKEKRIIGHHDVIITLIHVARASEYLSGVFQYIYICIFLLEKVAKTLCSGENPFR